MSPNLHANRSWQQITKVVTLWLGSTFDPQCNRGNFPIARTLHCASRSILTTLRRLAPSDRAGSSARRARPSTPLVGKITISVGNKTIPDLNKTGIQTVLNLERMRKAASITVPLNKQISIDLGFLNSMGSYRTGPLTAITC